MVFRGVEMRSAGLRIIKLINLEAQGRLWYAERFFDLAYVLGEQIRFV